MTSKIKNSGVGFRFHRTKPNHGSFWRICAVCLAISLFAGCGQNVVPRMPVTVTGNIKLPEGVESSGTAYISLYHAWALEGELRHPVQFIESFEATIGSFSIEAAYPIDKGEGLLVYVWLDTDGDGVLCTPTDRDDLAGLTVVEAFPAEKVTVEIELTAPCAGPDWFFPAA